MSELSTSYSDSNPEPIPGMNREHNRTDMKWLQHQNEIAAMIEPAEKLGMDQLLLGQYVSASKDTPEAAEKVVREMRAFFTGIEKYKKAGKEEALQVRDFVVEIGEKAYPLIDSKIDQIVLDDCISYSYILSKEDRRNLHFIPRETGGFVVVPGSYKKDYERIAHNSTVPAKDELAKGLVGTIFESYIGDQGNRAPENLFVIFEKVLKPYNDVLYMYNERYGGRINSLISAPIGEYGRSFAERLAVATTALLEIINSLRAELENEKLDTSEPNTAVVQKDMADMFAGGIISLEQAIVHLTAQKIDGYPFESDEKLIRDLVESGLVDQFARIIPYTGISGPLAMRGMYFDNLVIYEPGNGLALNKAIIKQFHEMRIRKRAQTVNQLEKRGFFEENEHYLKEQMLSKTLTGCPAAIHNPDGGTSVSRFSELFLRVFEQTATKPYDIKLGRASQKE